MSCSPLITSDAAAFSSAIWYFGFHAASVAAVASAAACFAASLSALSLADNCAVSNSSLRVCIWWTCSGVRSPKAFARASCWRA